MHRRLIIIILLLTPLIEAADYPSKYFRSPLGIPLVLSGTFGEPRSNHFHSGIDIKTNKKTGYRIYSVADGYVSRIKVSPYGYGKAIYIRHANGYTSVYAHLEHFNDKIDAYIKKQQYRNKRFALDLFPEASLFPVKKDQVVAYSGNSGSSSAPHVHYELRDTRTEEPINPLLFGLSVPDRTMPLIEDLAVYTVGHNRGLRAPDLFEVNKTNGSFSLKHDTIFAPATEVVFGLGVVDRLDGAMNRNGIYDLSMKVDGNEVYGFRMERLAFHQTRFVNAHIDFALKKKERKTVLRCFKEPGNRLPIYRNINNSGIVSLDPKGSTIEFTVKDAAGNTSELGFIVVPLSGPLVEAPPALGIHFDYDKSNTLLRTGISASFPQGSFYEDVEFEYAVSDTSAKNIVSRVHHLHNWYTPVHKYYSISIKPHDLPNDLKQKAVIVHRNEDGDLSSKGGTVENGWIKARARELGPFWVMVDTIPPRIRPVNISNGRNMAKYDKIRIRITDNLSGIKSYRTMLDGKWLLMEYQASRNMLTYFFDERVGPGEHTLQLQVYDDAGNRSDLKMRFKR